MEGPRSPVRGRVRVVRSRERIVLSVPHKLSTHCKLCVELPCTAPSPNLLPAGKRNCPASFIKEDLDGRKEERLHKSKSRTFLGMLYQIFKSSKPNGRKQIAAYISTSAFILPKFISPSASAHRHRHFVPPHQSMILPSLKLESAL